MRSPAFLRQQSQELPHQCQLYVSSNLIYRFAGAISSPHRGTHCANLTKIIIIWRVEGCSRSVIRSCGCDQEGRKLSWEAGIKEVGFEVFPETCNRGAISYLEGGRVPKNWGIVTERIGKCLIDL